MVLGSEAVELEVYRGRMWIKRGDSVALIMIL